MSIREVFDVDFNVDKAIDNVKKLDSASVGIGKKLANFASANPFKAGAIGLGVAGAAAYLGASGAGQFMTDVLFNNSITAYKKVSNNNDAMQRVIDIYGIAGKDASKEELEAVFRAEKEMLDEEVESEASVKDKLAGIRAKNVYDTATSELPSAIMKDLSENLNLLAKILKPLVDKLSSWFF